MGYSPAGRAAEGSGDVWQGWSRQFSPGPRGLPHGAPHGDGAPSWQILTPPSPLHAGDPPGCRPYALRPLLPGADGREGFHLPRGLPDKLLPLAGHCGADGHHCHLHGGWQGVLYPGKCGASGPASPGLGEDRNGNAQPLSWCLGVCSRQQAVPAPLGPLF